MEKEKWIEVIEKNKEQIMAGMKTAYFDAGARGFAPYEGDHTWYGFEVSISPTGEVETYRIQTSEIDPDVWTGKVCKIQRYSCWNPGDMEELAPGKTPEDRISDEWDLYGKEAAELYLDHLIATES